MSVAEVRRTTAPDGTSLAWRSAGPPSAPWLVLCNGAGCSEEYWTASFVPAASRRLRVLWWDYRGHHESKPSPDPRRYRVEDHAQDLLALLDAAGVGSAAFLGFSLGVQVTLEAYRRRPGAFRALALVSGSAEDPLATFAGLPALRPVLTGLTALGARIPRVTAQALRFGMAGPLALPVARWSRFCESDVPEGPFRAYLSKAGRLLPVAFMRTLRLMADHSARDVLRSINVPALLIAGLEDSMTPAAVMERMRDALGDVEYLPVRGGRHTLMMTRGAWVAARLLDFLERRNLLPRD
ncbi:MAG: alpha/beta fold hydrolase [Deltaproteobacteria bacterium]|nr:alpha/beta fold hydrolase [Deltaproteobacteria bacterium]